MKYYILRYIVIDGEHEYNEDIPRHCDTNECIFTVAHNLLETYLDDTSKMDNNNSLLYWFECGCRSVELKGIKKVCKKTFSELTNRDNLIPLMGAG